MGRECDVGEVEVANCIVVLGEVGRVAGEELKSCQYHTSGVWRDAVARKTYINLLLQVFLQLKVFDLRGPPCGEVCR